MSSTFNNSQRQSSSNTSSSSFFLRPSFQTQFSNNSNNMADIEFNESDLYSIDSSASSKTRKQPVVSGSRRSSKVAAAEMEASASRSVPVSIPEWSARMMQQQVESEGSDGDDDDGGDRESREPPHEFLARRRGASLSVHEGVGRTLKGRDMSRVRDAIWKRIGFED